MKKMFAVFLAIVFLGSITTFAQDVKSRSGKDAITAKFDTTRDAAKDLKDAIAQATKSGKRILLEAGGEWCKWCRALNKVFEEDKEILETIDKNYVFLKVNFSKNNQNKEFFSQFPKIPGYPHFFILNSDGSLLKSQDTGVLEVEQEKGAKEQKVGYRREKILSFLKEYAPASGN